MFEKCVVSLAVSRKNILYNSNVYIALRQLGTQTYSCLSYHIIFTLVVQTIIFKSLREILNFFTLINHLVYERFLKLKS